MGLGGFALSSQFHHRAFVFKTTAVAQKSDVLAENELPKSRILRAFVFNPESAQP
jgi:hypothetical protein